MFITGASEIPPMEFLSRGYIDFEHDSSRKLPSVSTCSLTLNLPVVLNDIMNFKKLWTLPLFVALDSVFHNFHQLICFIFVHCSSPFVHLLSHNVLRTLYIRFKYEELNELILLRDIK